VAALGPAARRAFARTFNEREKSKSIYQSGGTNEGKKRAILFTKPGGPSKIRIHQKFDHSLGGKKDFIPHKGKRKEKKNPTISIFTRPQDHN